MVDGLVNSLPNAIFWKVRGTRTVQRKKRLSSSEIPIGTRAGETVATRVTPAMESGIVAICGRLPSYWRSM